MNGDTEIVQYGADNKRTVIASFSGFHVADEVMEGFIGYDAQGQPVFTTVNGEGDRVIITQGYQSLLPSISSGR